MGLNYELVIQEKLLSAYQKVASHLPYKILIETRPQNSRFIQKSTGKQSFFINILLKQNEYWKILKFYGRH